jgi:hypothetical protein
MPSSQPRLDDVGWSTPPEASPAICACNSSPRSSNQLAEQVVASAVLACDWHIPPPPDGEAFDPARANVRLTLNGTAEQLLKVPDVSQCSNRIQTAASAQVDLQFGCETRLRPPE